MTYNPDAPTVKRTLLGRALVIPTGMDFPTFLMQIREVDRDAYHGRWPLYILTTAEVESFTANRVPREVMCRRDNQIGWICDMNLNTPLSRLEKNWYGEALYDFNLVKDGQFYIAAFPDVATNHEKVAFVKPKDDSTMERLQQTRLEVEQKYPEAELNWNSKQSAIAEFYRLMCTDQI